jgi:hypothetical protein
MPGRLWVVQSPKGEHDGWVSLKGHSRGLWSAKVSKVGILVDPPVFHIMPKSPGPETALLKIASSHVHSGEESWTTVAMRCDGLYVDVGVGTGSPEFDEKKSSSPGIVSTQKVRAGRAESDLHRRIELDRNTASTSGYEESRMRCECV